MEVDASGGSGRLHLAYVDGLRALAAMYVMCVHLLPRAWGIHAPRSPVLRALAKVTAQGHFAVTAFIVISGFCLMLPAVRAGMRMRGGAGVFLVRRFWRIAPPLYAAVLLAVLVLQAPAVRLAHGYPPVTSRQLVAHALLIQNFVPRGLLPDDGPLWSISVECLMYLFFPLLVGMARGIGAVATAAIYVACGYLLGWVFDGTALASGTWQYLGAFALGALAAACAFGPSPATRRLRERIPWHLLAAVCLAGVAAAIARAGWARAERRAALFDLPVAVAVAAVLVGASRMGPNRLRMVLGWRPLAAIGLFSYSLYMIHYPLADVFCELVPSPPRVGELTREALLVAVVAPAIIAVSYGFYWAFERPFHQLSRRVGR